MLRTQLEASWATPRATDQQRTGPVEPALSLVKEDHGQIKQAGGFRQFAMRGLSQMNAEWQLVCLTHNRLKLWRAVPAESALDRDHPPRSLHQKNNPNPPRTGA